MTATTAYDAIVLAGGAAKRLGGADKPAVSVGGRALLDRVLAACRDAGRTVVVGGRRPTARPVVWAREEPAGGGPLAALDAGVRHTAADSLLVLSADLPFLREGTVRRLVGALAARDGEGVVLTDADGVTSPWWPLTAPSPSDVNLLSSPPNTGAFPGCRCVY
jgi:molybdopterin-guanine dinucleotide biosynthesis protein A